MANTVATFRAAKGVSRLSMLTAYDYTMARLVDEAGINCILVGDSLGMVMLGHDSTLKVTMEDMIHHCAAVARGAKNALILCDMPFMSSQNGIENTVRNAGRLVQKGGAQAVKMEGGQEFCGEIKAMVRASIPVMAHLGLTPQSVNAFGGYKVQGKTRAAAQKLLDDARAVQDAGAFAVLLECVPVMIAKKITETLEVPTIGIGAGRNSCASSAAWPMKSKRRWPPIAKKSNTALSPQEIIATRSRAKKNCWTSFIENMPREGHIQNLSSHAHPALSLRHAAQPEPRIRKPLSAAAPDFVNYSGRVP